VPAYGHLYIHQEIESNSSQLPRQLSAPKAGRSAYPSIILRSKNPATQTFLEHMATLTNKFLSLNPAILTPELSRGADACISCVRHRFWDGVIPSLCTMCKTCQRIRRAQSSQSFHQAMFAHPHEQQYLRPLSNVFTACFTKLSLRSPEYSQVPSWGRGPEKRSALRSRLSAQFSTFRVIHSSLLP